MTTRDPDRSGSVSAWLARMVEGDTALLATTSDGHRAHVVDELEAYQKRRPASSDTSYESVIVAIDGAHVHSLRDELAEATDLLSKDGTLLVVVMDCTDPVLVRPMDLLEALSHGLYPQESARGPDWYGMTFQAKFDPSAYGEIIRGSEARYEAALDQLNREAELSHDRQRRINDLTDDHRAARREIDELRRETELLERLHREVAGDLRRTTKRLEETTQRLKATERDGAALQNTLQKERAASKAERDQAKQDIQNLQQSLENVRKREHGLVDRVNLLTGKVAALEERDRRQRDRIQRLEQNRTVLRHRLAVEHWKRQRMRARRWWRLGAALGSAARNPWKLVANAKSLGEAFRRIPTHPRPELPENLAAESSTGASGDPAASRAQAKVDASSPSEGDVRSDQANARAGEPQPSDPDRTPSLRSGRSPSLPSLAAVPRPRREEVRMAAVVDEMSAASFGPECELITFTPNTWRATLEEIRPHLLLVESAWKGNNGSWEYRIGSYSYPESEGLPDLRALVEWCRERDIPTVFWNKEDPIHFEKFKQAAALFDVILTTDAECLPRYESLPDSRATVLGVLPFAAQPRLHHPVAQWPRDPRPVFGGTFYRNRHPDRRAQLEMLLDAAVPFDLVIFDRMGGKVTDSFGFPERFHSHIEGGLPYREMVERYRRHRVFLNTNSVTSSPTMFSRRVFELLACGTPVVSTPSLGVTTTFGDLVSIVTNREEADAAIAKLVEDDDHWMTASLTGITTIARDHLYEDRLATILDRVGISHRIGKPSVAALHRDARDQLVLLDDLARWKPDGTADGRSSAHDLSAVQRLADQSEAAWIAIGSEPHHAAELEELSLIARLVETDMIVGDGTRSFEFVKGQIPARRPLLIRRDRLAEGWAAMKGEEPSALGIRALSVPHR